ncbi:MAG: response regulator [Anaerolineales bacterium]|nr:response regulator [Anaerolineales bacterium]
MLYKVFLVEDEIVAREGIRDNVDWASVGFEFCGEAPDGEMALPLIESIQPDVLITDIKMPFMDGLQLCKIIREHMPWVKIIILSGHDEFNYAQAAIKLGVSEYLLKPVSVKDLHAVLQRAAETLDREKKARQDLKRLHDQVENNLALLREKFLLRLVMGGISSAEAIEQSQQLGLNIIANYYLVVFIKIELCEKSQPFDYNEYQRVERIVSSLVSANPDVFLAKKDVEELVLLIKGDHPEQLEQEGSFLAEMVKRELEERTNCSLAIEMGSPQQRLGDIHYSFAEALVKVKGATEESLSLDSGDGRDQIERLKLDQSALEHYLKSGMAQDFDAFFDAYLQPVGKAALRSQLVKHYIFVDVILTAAQFVSDLDGDIDQVIPEIHHVDKLLAKVKSVDQTREDIRKIFTATLNFRDSLVNHEQAMIVHQAKSYIDSHFSDADLSLTEVAARVNLSSSHFSVLFSQEMGETFRDYLTRIRIERAKELLRMTSLMCYQVAERCGYNDSHYFSYIFKKNTGVSPQRFRSQIPGDESPGDLSRGDRSRGRKNQG